MTLVRFVAGITEVDDSFKMHIDMKDMHPGQSVRGHESEVDGSIRPHQKWSFRKRKKNPPPSSQWFRKLLPVAAINILNISLLRVENVVRDDGENSRSIFSV